MIFSHTEWIIVIEFCAAWAGLLRAAAGGGAGTWLPVAAPAAAAAPNEVNCLTGPEQVEHSRCAHYSLWGHSDQYTENLLL